MPDHWHALIAFPDATLMEKSIRDWKRFTARQADLSWQDGFFEHRLRSRQSAEEKWHYISLTIFIRNLDIHIFLYLFSI